MAACSPAGWGHGAEDRVQLSRGGALGAPPASAPFKGAAGTTNNLWWWAVVDFLAELPQAGFPCSGEVSQLLRYISIYRTKYRKPYKTTARALYCKAVHVTRMPAGCMCM